MKQVFLAALAAFVFSSAHAETGNELLSQLKSSNVSDNLRAYAYINGVIDADTSALVGEIVSRSSKATQDGKTIKPDTRFVLKHVCIPDGVTGSQIFDLVTAKLESRPDMRHMPANTFVSAALIDVWPCKLNP